MTGTPETPEPHGEASRPALAPASGGGLLARWFEPVRVAHDTADSLRELASRGSLVFVMRSPGLLNYLYLRWYLRRIGLPALRAAQGFPGFFGWASRVRRGRRAFQEAVASGAPTLVFLGRRQVERDPFAALVNLQRGLFQPVFLIPVLLVWSRRAQKLEPSLWDLLYGSPEAPSAFANAIAFLRAFRRALFDVGLAVDLKAFLVDRAAEPDASVARKVRGALHQHLAREFRTVVGPPLKAPSRVCDKVCRDRTLRGALDAVCRDEGKAPEAAMAEARKDLAEIASNYDPVTIRILRAILSRFFGRLYTSVEVDEEGLARLKRAASEAPIVLCPSHKSYIDFLVLSWLLYEHGMTPPHIAAGINLSFWPFGSIARRGGAFFIRRKVKGDRIYTAVLRAYVKHLLRDRFPQEFFVEGGRSRTGKLLPPKAGLISMEVDAWLDGAADDVAFVPVAVDYEKLMEAQSYANELAGGEKAKENFRGLLGAVRVLFRRYERLYVQFEEPISLAKVARERLGARAASLAVDAAWVGETDRPGALAPGAKDAPAEAKRQLVQGIANRVAYGISRAVTITPVGLVAAALLSHVRRGIGSAEVSRRIDLLRYIAAEGGARFARGLRGAPSDPRAPGPIADAVRRLEQGGLVRVEEAAGDTIYQVVDDKRPVLDYHRNAVIHRYVAPALVAAAALPAPGLDATEPEVRQRAKWLSRLFKLEFMYRTGAAFDEIFDQNVAFLERVGALARPDGQLRPGAEADLLEFLAELTRPYLEAYRLAAATALALVGPDAPRHGAGIDRRTLVKEALERGRAGFLSGQIALREALSKATLENAVEWLVAQGLLAEESGKLHLPSGVDGTQLRAIMDGITPLLAR